MTAAIMGVALILTFWGLGYFLYRQFKKGVIADDDLEELRDLVAAREEARKDIREEVDSAGAEFDRGFVHGSKTGGDTAA